MMNVKKALIKLRERYFRPVIARKDGILTHFADCEIYRSVAIYHYAPCTCGFNHDLSHLPEGIKSKLNPHFWEEYRQQEAAVPAGDPLDVEQLYLMLDVPHEEQENTKYQDEEDWKLICDVFGQEYEDFLKGQLE